MKIKHFLFAILIGFVFITACGDEVVDSDSSWIPILVEPVSIECDYLDSIFSNKNQLFPTYLNPNFELQFEGQNGLMIPATICIINSKKELDAINSFDFDVNCIDFSQYTLIGGCIGTHSMFPITDISLLEKKNNYFFNVNLDYNTGLWTAPGILYFWKLYPKLKIDKQVLIKIADITEY